MPLQKFIRANLLHPGTGTRQIAAVDPETGKGHFADKTPANIFNASGQLKGSASVWVDENAVLGGTVPLDELSILESDED